MRYRLLYSLALVSLALASCQVSEEELFDNNAAGNVTFYASQGDNTTVRTELTSDGSIRWLPKEEITLFYGDGLSTKFVSSNSEPSEDVEFKGSLLTGNSENGYWALYPYDPDAYMEGETIVMTCPSTQKAQAGTFAPGMFPSIARTFDYSLRFLNVAGGVKFSITEEGVKSVVFQGNNNEPLAGRVRIILNEEGTPDVKEVIDPATKVTLSASDGDTFKTGSWYYISALPGSLEKGYKITFIKEDGTTAVSRISDPVTIKRSVWGALKDADKGLSYSERIPANEIRYTTKSGKPVEYEKHGDFEVLSNEYENGMGRMVFDRDLKTIYKYLFYFSDVTSVTIPEEVTSIGYYAFGACMDLVSITLPEGLEVIEDGAFSSCLKLSGLTLPNSVKSIGVNALFETPIESVNLAEGLEEIGIGAFYMCSELTTVTIPSSVKTIGRSAFSRCDNLERVELRPTNPPVCSPNSFGDPYSWGEKSEFPLIVPEASAKEYAESPYFKDCLSRLYTAGGTPLASMAYESKDYSMDGEIVLLQEASVGRGINLVFVGDGFTDRDMEPGGWYEKSMRKGMETLFCWEPLKSLRDRFNVYEVKVVSANDSYGWAGAKRAFSHDEAGTESLIKTVTNKDQALKALSYSDAIPNQHSIPTTVFVLHNTELILDRSSCSTDAEFHGCSVSTIYELAAIAHEFGHGFAELWDEYVGMYPINLTQERKDELDLFHQEVKAANVDWKNDVATVAWAHFISDSRYSDEKLGAYQGASFSDTDLYRPTEDSCMNDHHLAFNAPSREAIYKYTMKYSEGDSWTYDYEEFVKFDKAGRDQWRSHIRWGYPQPLELPD